MSDQLVVPPNPTWDDVARAIDRLGIQRSEWAGIPRFNPDFQIVVEPRFPYQFKDKDAPPDDPRDTPINSWFHPTIKGLEILVERQTNGKSRAWLAPTRTAGMLFGTIAIAKTCWSMEAEWKAMGKLEELIGDHQFRSYFLTGTFMESSKRSKTTYVFRKLRPTLAFSRSDEKEVKILCALCLHPIGYYQSTWCGVMVPTDDVIAHLVLMRGDEKEYWKRSNQIPIHYPNAGL